MLTKDWSMYLVILYLQQHALGSTNSLAGKNDNEIERLVPKNRL